MTRTTTVTVDGETHCLIEHDGISEVYVCADCGHETDLASDMTGLTKEQADAATCAACGKTNTAWMRP